VRRAIFIFLNLCLCLVLFAGSVSLLDDSLALWVNFHGLTVFSGFLSFCAMAVLFLVYLLMGVTPMIPKRIFLPLAILFALILLAVIPGLIYSPHRVREGDLISSFLVVIAGFIAMAQLQGGFRFEWQPVSDKQLGDRWFSFKHSLVYLVVNLFIVVPLLLGYFLLCASLAINHYSDGFLALRPGGLSVQERTYVRPDGKSIQLVPMIHVGDAGFYEAVSRSFPTNALILMEGVTDRRSLLTNELSYKRMAKSLGLSEQEDNFAPAHGEMIFADVDISQFNTNTIGFLNLVMLFYSHGVNARSVEALLHYTPPPQFEEQLFDDLLLMRNQHILDEVRARLPQSDCVVLPWGVAHMPDLARQIQKDGFRLDTTSNYTAIPFFSAAKKP
jgi:hypothetical protein